MNSGKLLRAAPLALLTILVSLSSPAPASSAVVQETDEDPGGLQRLYYEMKPAVVYIWATAEASIDVAGSYDLDPEEGGVYDFLDEDENLLLGLRAVVGASGSGWLITPDGYVVTNGHVVQLFHEENEQQLQAELFFAALEESGFFAKVAQQRAGGGELGHDVKIQLMQRLLPFAEIVVTKNLQVFTQNWREYPAEVKEYSPPIYPFEGRVAVPGTTLASGKDVAILKIEGRDLPTVPIGDSDAMRIGEPVHLAGYPMVTRSMFVGQLNPETEMEASFTRGQVSSVKMDVKGSSVLQYDAATSPGHSGGPLLNDAGEVVGMATMGADAGFYFAVPTSVIREFVRSAGVTPARGMFDRNWDETLDAYYTATRSGDHDQLRMAVAGFDQALRIMPDLRDALELRREAMATLDQMGDGGGGGPLPWIIGGVILLGLLLVGLGLARRGGGEEEETVVIEPTPRPAAIPAGSDGVGRLVVEAGPLQGNRFPVPEGGLKIGRDPSSCQIVLSEGTVSREHASIAPSGRDSEVKVRNLSGTNPTYVNDRAIQETTLRSGDQIRIGNSVLHFEQP